MTRFFSSYANHLSDLFKVKNGQNNLKSNIATLRTQPYRSNDRKCSYATTTEAKMCFSIQPFAHATFAAFVVKLSEHIKV